MAKVKKIFTVAIGLCVGVLFLFTGAREFQNSRRLANEGKATVGQVIDQEMRLRRRGRTSHYLLVRFQVDARHVCTERIAVDRDLFYQVSRGSSVKVHYLPSDPTVCAAGERVKTQYAKLLWGALFLVGTGVLVILNRRTPDARGTVSSIGKHESVLMETAHAHERALTKYDKVREYQDRKAA